MPPGFEVHWNQRACCRMFIIRPATTAQLLAAGCEWNNVCVCICVHVTCVDADLYTVHAYVHGRSESTCCFSVRLHEYLRLSPCKIDFAVELFDFRHGHHLHKEGLRGDLLHSLKPWLAALKLRRQGLHQSTKHGTNLSVYSLPNSP